MGTGRGGMRCIKILLCIFNLTFWLAGLAVIAFGLWLRFGGVMADFASEKKSPEYFFMGLYVLVGAGALMTTVGFFGCCGAARESQCLLGAFFACLLVIFAAEVTAGVFAFIGKKVAIQEAQKIYEDIYDDYMKNPGGEVNRTIFRYHLALQCCGKDNMEQQMGLPCPENIQMPKNCLIEIQNVIDANLHLIGIVGIAIAGITPTFSLKCVWYSRGLLLHDRAVTNRCHPAARMCRNGQSVSSAGSISQQASTTTSFRLRNQQQSEAA